MSAASEDAMPGMTATTTRRGATIVVVRRIRAGAADALSANSRTAAAKVAETAVPTTELPPTTVPNNVTTMRHRRIPKRSGSRVLWPTEDVRRFWTTAGRPDDVSIDGQRTAAAEWDRR
jgi:hypothetical protein